MSRDTLFIGPALPKHLSRTDLSNDTKSKKNDNSSECTSRSAIGPTLPPHMHGDQKPEYDSNKRLEECDSLSANNIDDKTLTSTMGPMLPPYLLKTQINDVDSKITLQKCSTDSVSEYDSDLYGPALPPHLKKSNLPECSGYVDPKYVNNSGSPSGNSSEDDDVIGPVPEGTAQKISLNQQQLEIRANYLKRKMAEEAFDSKEVSKREKWMLELPPEKAKNLGLGPRSFRMKEGPDMSNRSDWTDTPADRARKELLGHTNDNKVSTREEMNLVSIRERDKAMERMVKKSKDEKRELSLLEMHQKKLKKKKKEKSNEKPERRPFDRDIDLQANRFDEAQKKSIFKKAQLLNSRFSQGQSKYL